MPEESEYFKPAIGSGKEINKENVLEFLNSFKIRTGMYVSKPDDYDVVTSFLGGFFLCCNLHGFHYYLDINNSTQNNIPDFINNVIREIEAEF